MTDRQCECILMIADEGSISTAARKLCISQSSLSQMLSHVEADLGAKLFSRGGRRLTPTFEGQKYLESARQILGIYRNLRNQLSDTDCPTSGHLTIGIATRRSWLFMPLVLPSYMRLYPDVKIVFVEEDQNELDRLIAQGKVDIAFTTRTKTNEDVVYDHIYNEHIMAVISNEHELARTVREEDFDLSMTKDIQYILTREGHDIRRIIDRIFEDFAMNPSVLLESHSMDVCLQIASSGICATIVPETLVKLNSARHKVKCYRIGEKYHRDVAIAYRSDLVLTFIMREFIRISKENIIACVAASPEYSGSSEPSYRRE